MFRTSFRWYPHFAALALVLLEMGWLVPWYRMVIRVSTVASPMRSGLVLGGVMFLAYAAGQGMEWLRLREGFKRLLIGLLFFASLFMALRWLLDAPGIALAGGLVNLDPGAFLVSLAMLWVWWRGMTLARDLIRPAIAWRRFVLGVVMFGAHVLIVTRLGPSAAGAPPGLAAFSLFLFVGLFAMVLARVSAAGLVEGQRRNPFDRRWLGGTLLLVGLTVAIASATAGLLTGQQSVLLDELREGLGFLVSAVLFVSGLPFLLIGYLLGPLIPWVRAQLPQATVTPEPNPFGMTYPGPGLANNAAPTPIEAQRLIFWGLAILLLLILAARMRFGNTARRRIVETESLLEEGEARRRLRQALQDAAGRLRTRLRPARRVWAAQRIRQIYAQLMDICEAIEKPRPAALTPLEFLPQLGRIMPLHTEALALLTDAYVRVRYGELPETQEELDALEAAWQAVEQTGRKLVGEHQAELRAKIALQKQLGEKAAPIEQIERQQ